MERMKIRNYQLYVAVISKIDPYSVNRTVEEQWEAYLIWCKQQENLAHE